MNHLQFDWFSLVCFVVSVLLARYVVIPSMIEQRHRRQVKAKANELLQVQKAIEKVDILLDELTGETWRCTMCWGWPPSKRFEHEPPPSLMTIPSAPLHQHQVQLAHMYSVPQHMMGHQVLLAENGVPEVVARPSAMFFATNYHDDMTWEKWYQMNDPAVYGGGWDGNG